MVDKRLFSPLRMAMWLPLAVFAGLCFVFFVSLDFSPRQNLPSPLIDHHLPTFALPELRSGSMQTQEDLPREAFLLNVWATWCFPCREEHPILMDIFAEDIAIVGLNYKDDAPKASAWLDALGDPYRLNLVDSLGTYGLELGVYGVPATYLVDASRVIRYKHIGPISEAQWRQELSPLFHSLQQVSPDA